MTLRTGLIAAPWTLVPDLTQDYEFHLLMDDYVDQATKTAVYPGQRNNGDTNEFNMTGLTYTVLGLCGEAGELANKVKKYIRAGATPDSDVLADELGDVLWYVSAICNEINLELSTVAKRNLLKLAIRKQKNAIALMDREPYENETRGEFALAAMEAKRSDEDKRKD